MGFIDNIFLVTIINCVAQFVLMCAKLNQIIISHKFLRFNSYFFLRFNSHLQDQLEISIFAKNYTHDI